jgi:hypothetical protein
MSEDIPSTAPGNNGEIVRWSGWSTVWQRLVKRAESLGATLCPIWGLWIFSYRHHLTHLLAKACDTLLLYLPYHHPHKIKSITPITNYLRQKALTAMAATLFTTQAGRSIPLQGSISNEESFCRDHEKELEDSQSRSSVAPPIKRYGQLGAPRQNMPTCQFPLTHLRLPFVPTIPTVAPIPPVLLVTNAWMACSIRWRT